MSLLTNRYRIVIIAVTFLCLTSISSNYNIINFAFICMKDDYSSIIEDGNVTKSAFDYTPKEKSAILWAVAVGTLVGMFPINYFYNKYGARYPFFIAGMLSVVSTFVMPAMAAHGLPFLLVFRFFQGLSYSADFAAIGLICVRWAPLSEMAIFIGILTSFTPFASTITNSLTGELCTSSYGWRSSFYLHALGGLVLFCLWLFLYSDDPQTATSVTQKELTLIQRNKSKQHLEAGSSDVPYMKIIRNPQVLCVWGNAFVEMSVAILINTYSPIYFHQVLHYSVPATGYLLATGMFSQFPFKVAAAVCSDKITWLSERTKMIFFNTLAVGLPGIVMILLGYVPVSHAWIAMLLFAAFQWLSCMNCGGFYKCGSLVSRQYAHIVIGTIQSMKCVALFISPLLVSLFVEDETNQSQWTHVFLVCGILLLIANFVSYPIFTDEPAAFTEAPDKGFEAGVPEKQKEVCDT